MNIRRNIVLGGVALLALVGSFGAGRYSRPAVERTEARATTDTRIADKLALATAELVNVKRDLATWQARAASAEAHTVTTTEWVPATPAANGCPAAPAHVRQIIVADTHAEEHVQGGTKAAADEQRKADTKATRDVVAEDHQTVVTLHTVEARPSWSVALMPGYQLAGEKAVPLRGDMVVGAAVERRLVGGLFLGAWGSTSGAAGLLVRYEQ